MVKLGGLANGRDRSGQDLENFSQAAKSSQSMHLALGTIRP
jgi:hypothetical protein